MVAPSRRASQSAIKDREAKASSVTPWLPVSKVTSSTPGMAAVRSASMQAGPALEFTSLIRTEVDYGAMEDIAEGTWQQFSWAHVLRAFVIWVVIFFAAYGAYLQFFHQP